MWNIMDKVELKDETAILPNPCYVQCGDNLELLKSQPNESVNMIYCDILYGTGRNFGDYKDLKPIRSEIEAHYLPRLIEMHRVLKSTGSIYLQMDTKVNHWLRILMDDVFGYKNFQNEIIWHYKGTGVSKTFVKKHDIILLYSKTEKFTHNTIYVSSIKKTGWTGKNEKRCDDVWSDINTLFQSKERGTQMYNTQKPKALIERIIKASSNEGDTVADYYLGSGTTAVVCKELNRNFIGCDLNPKAIEITKARLNGGQ
jgi:site-specific DNA-methyltransferase (adenine-specific)